MYAQVCRLDQLSNENKKFQDNISIFFCYLSVSAVDFVFHNVAWMSILYIFVECLDNFFHTNHFHPLSTTNWIKNTQQHSILANHLVKLQATLKAGSRRNSETTFMHQLQNRWTRNKTNFQVSGNESCCTSFIFNTSLRGGKENYSYK